MKILLLSLVCFLNACAASPHVVVNKNITVTVEGVQAQLGTGTALQNPYYPFPVLVTIEYTTTSDIPIKADVKQTAEDVLKAKIPVIR